MTKYLDCRYLFALVSPGLVPFVYYQDILPTVWMVGLLILISITLDCVRFSLETNQHFPKRLFDILLYALCISHVLVIWWGVWVAGAASLMEVALLSIGIGLSSAGMFFSSHELLHRNTPSSKYVTLLALSHVMYGTFRLEHIYGHHRDVATPRDPSSCPRGVSIYKFMLPAIVGNIRKGYLIATLRSNRKIRNEAVLGWCMSLSFLFLAYFLSAGFGVLLLIVQSCFAIVLLESANYIEHYGLRRKLVSKSEYERVGVSHAWDSNHLLSSWTMLNLPKHTDHHLHAAKPMETLVNLQNAPKLKLGYYPSIMLAWIPILWFREMNAELDQFAQRNENGSF